MRAATSDDAVRLSALATQVFLHTYATEGVNDNLAQYVLEQCAPESFERLVGDPSRALLVEESGDALVGFVELAFDTPCPDEPDVTTEIATLYVTENFTRRSIGTRLLEAAADAACARSGSPDLWLAAYAGNSDAAAFYANRGFVRVRTLQYVLGTGTHENHVYVRSRLTRS